jgi:hypothetical protein
VKQNEKTKNDKTTKDKMINEDVDTAENVRKKEVL